MYARVVVGAGKGVLFREVSSLFRGVLIEGLYILVSIGVYRGCSMYVLYCVHVILIV